MPTVARSLVIKNRLGLHARAAALLMQTAAKYRSDIRVTKDGQTVDGKSILGLMMLAAAKGTEIGVEIDGDDAAEAIEAITDLVNRGFYEDA